MEVLETVSVDSVVMHEAKALAMENGVSVNEVVKQALEHGILVLREIQFFRLRCGKGNLAESLEILRRAGDGRPPDLGDEIPADVLALYPELQSRQVSIAPE